ncbi:MAG: hypothetical protein D3911_07530 [Candidatus Electrothrix sp. AW3_4]|nr:hypothetical protein [Candidatus Electrothrix gigas]
MQLDPTIRKQLLANNPFSFSAAGDPRENDYPDVEGIDQEVTQSISQLIEQKQKQPGIPRAAIVLGETGSGKTHMIGRLIKAGSKGKPPFSFAYLQPFIDPNCAFRYLLKEIVSNLYSTSYSNEKYSQIDYVSGQIIAKVLFKVAERYSDDKIFKIARTFQASPLKALKRKYTPKDREKLLQLTKNFLKDNHDELNVNFLHVLRQYFFFEEKRRAARHWFMGKAIDQEDCELLGIRDYRSTQTPEAAEEEARQILLSLDLILNTYGDRPLIVFFDQLENLTTKEQLGKFNQLLQFFCDRTRAMMPISFFRGDEWNDNFRVNLDHQIVTRLEGNEFLLKGCTQNQAKEIIRSRLDMVLSGIQRPDSLYPFSVDAKEFERVIDHQVKSPRDVINRANQLLFSITEIDIEVDTPHQVLAKTFSNKIAKILANFDHFEPDEGRLTLALQLYLNNRPENAGYTVEQLDESLEKIKFIDLVGRLRSIDGSVYKVAFLVDVELHFRTVGASLRRGIALMQKKEKNRAVFIRDMRCPFPELPKWPATNQRLQEIEDAGGSKIFLDTEAAAHWYALALLKFDVEAGDVSCEDGTSITRPQFNAFIRDCLNGKAFPAFAKLDDYLKAIPDGSSKKAAEAKPKKKATSPPKSTPPSKHEQPDNPPVTKPSSEEIAQMAGEILKQIPVRMLKADLLVNKLSGKHSINTDKLLHLLEDYHEQFTLIRATDHTIIKLK